MTHLSILALFAFLVICQASILILEEGTPNESDWRQLTIELPPATFDNDGSINFPRPIWLRREGDDVEVFPVLGSLVCPSASDTSVAARIGGEWVCVDIDDARLPPVTTDKKRDVSKRVPAFKRASEGRVDPPICFEDMAPAVWVSAGVWECGNPLALIQAVNTDERRPECQDTDLVVFNEVGVPEPNLESWFECRALNLIEFDSTISTEDFRWQTPSTVRHIGSLARTSRVRSGTYTNFRWSNYVFDAATDLIARDQTSPPERINNGGALWVAYTISTTFVGISGFNPYEQYDFFPVYPGAELSYLEQLEALVPGSLILGDSLTFTPGTVQFASNTGDGRFTAIDLDFVYDSSTAANGFAVVPVNSEVDLGLYPTIQIAERVSNWYVGPSSEYDPNLVLCMTMWLQYVDPSGF